MHSIFCKLIISFMHQVIGFIPPIPNQPVQIETFVFKCATLPDPLYL